MRRWDRDILRVAAEIGIASASLEPGGKHQFVVGTVDGVPFRRAVAGSPSDGKRAITKARSDLKREMRAALSRT